MKNFVVKKLVDCMFSIFVFLGSKLFDTVAIYSPEDEVLGIHFAVSKKELNKSCEAMASSSWIK